VDAGARARLAALRSAAVARLDALSRSFEDVVGAAEGANADDEHDPEGATLGFERAQLAALAARAADLLREVDAALARVDDGTYGVCERCGAAIPDARLAARPTAATCLACATRRR
jgi:RNA polymerase-binding protein DksA